MFILTLCLLTFEIRKELKPQIINNRETLARDLLTKTNY